ncbi:hypothetical protein ACFV47_44735 [Streptomyces solisilvae]|uniref:hypothetical protein n=1 Tax=Streptomyces malaysiensis TaxID=92644 RepID=UPI0036B393B6
MSTRTARQHAYAAASADCAAELLQHHSHPEVVLTKPTDVLESASWSLRFQQDHNEIIATMQHALERMPDQAKPVWSKIIAGPEACLPDGIR